VIPAKLEWWRETREGAAWLDRLPRLIEECAERWEPELEPPFERGNASYCAPAGAAVLKLNAPGWETEHEADALAHWDGGGAARLLARDDERGALLIERLRPGGQLWGLPDRDADAVAAEVLPQLWSKPVPPDHPFTTLAEAVERWNLDEETRESLRSLAATQGEPVVLHQDLQGSNVLHSERGWLAIDPKPLVGEREFDLASFVRDRRWELDPRRIRQRLDFLCAELELDRERARLYAIGHARAWGADDPQMLACAQALS
jgi:streptomycin 6-kinase